MNSKRKDKEQKNRKGNTVLVAVDFSPCSVVALRRARTILGQKPGRILVLHVIDQDFIVRCIHNRLGTEEHIKKTLYLRARDKLQNLLRAEGMDGEGIEELICEGDQDFIVRCIHNRLGTEEHIKKTLYLRARDKLKNLLRAEGMDGEGIEELICEGTAFIEINKRAVESGADMVVMGNRGNSGDMETIFFGSTAERVLRFMKRPVLCVPLEEDQD
jgi:nucleotide-binding universal stress UspA family protein